MSYITTCGLMENQKTNMVFRLLIGIIRIKQNPIYASIALQA